MNIKRFILNCLSAILIVTLFATTYVALVIFLCCSVQMVISYFISFITSALTKDWYDFGNNLLWIFYSIPYIHLLLGINLKVIMSYFLNIWNVLSFNGIQSTIRSDFEKSKCSKAVIVLKYIAIVCVIVLLSSLLLVEIFTSNEEAEYSVIIGVISVIVPVIGFFKIIYHSFRSLFMSAENLTISLHNIEQQINEMNNNESEGDNECSFKNDNNSIKQSLIDPCGVMNQIEYLNYIKDAEVNHFGSFFKILKFEKKMIPGLIVVLFVATSIILDTCAFVKQEKYKNNVISCVGYGIRIVFYIASLPFLMIFNFAGLFIDTEKTKGRHAFIRKMWIFVLLFYLVFLVASTTFLIIISLKFEPFEIKDLEYNNNNNINNKWKFSEPSSVCGTKFHNLSMLQYAGLAALGSTKDSKISANILKYVFDGEEKPFDLVGNGYSFAYLVNISSDTSVIVFNSLIDKDGISFLLENFFNDFIPSRIFRMIIPFYDLTHNLVLARFLNILTERLTFFVGVTQVSPHYVDFNIEINKKTREMKKNNPNLSTVFTGHSIGGILAKSIGANFMEPSVAFESLSYYRSLFQASMLLYNNEPLYSSSDSYPSNAFQMINAYSPSQLFSTQELNSTINVKLPKWKSVFNLVNPYDTFCTFAAGCATDQRFDGFCNASIGFDSYLYLFKLWGRKRELIK